MHKHTHEKANRSNEHPEIYCNDNITFTLKLNHDFKIHCKWISWSKLEQDRRKSNVRKKRIYKPKMDSLTLQF